MKIEDLTNWDLIAFLLFALGIVTLVSSIVMSELTGIPLPYLLNRFIEFFNVFMAGYILNMFIILFRRKK